MKTYTTLDAYKLGAYVPVGAILRKVVCCETIDGFYKCSMLGCNGDVERE